MKQSTLFVFFVLTMKILFSQTVITKDINFSTGDTYRYDGYEGVTNIEPGSSGANQTWDFGSITGYRFYEGLENICTDPSTTPFADSSATNGANICIMNPEPPHNGPLQYFACGNNDMVLLAIGYMATGGNSLTSYVTPQTALEFPFAYGNNFEDEWESFTYSIDMGHFITHDSATVIVEADAYGNITTPEGEYQNVLRVKRTTTFTSWSNYSGVIWILLGQFTDIQYEWYAPGIKVPVMIVTEMDGFEDFSVRYLVDHNFTTGIPKTNEAMFEVFPNPAATTIQINSDKTINRVSIYSMNGQKLKEIPTHGDQSHFIDIKELAKGNYLLKAEFNDGTNLTRNILKQ